MANTCLERGVDWMHDVFISYARETASVAGAAAKALREAGHSVWLDDAIPAHRPYTDVITEQLDAAKAVVVIWSVPATRSQWVRSEANRAREGDKLVQLRIDEALLPMPFDQIQCVDLEGWRGEPDSPGWRKILASVSSLTGAAPPPATAAVEAVPAMPSIAVLSLRDLSPARDQGYFCDGLVEELIMSLTRLPGLRVASPALVGTAHQLTAEQLAQLGVTALLEGSVRKDGEHARIAVRLVQSRDGLTLWAQSFDSTLGDIFALQERIARDVVEALGLKLFPGTRGNAHEVGTGSAAALDFYLRGKALVRRELESERRNAGELFRQAIAADPQFAQAHAALADVLTEIVRQRPPDWQAAAQEALAAADRAVEIAPGLPDAHLARGGILRFGHHADAESEFRKAIELGANDPNIHYRFARFLVLEGRKREAIEQYEEAFRLSPDDYRYVVYTLQEYQALGDAEGERSALERSWSAIERHLEINPDDVRALGHGAGVLALLGRPDDCEGFIRRALRIRPDDYGNLVTLACAAVLNRDPDRALDLLEAAVATGRGDKEWMLNDNDLRPLHGHPRFEALVARMI